MTELAASLPKARRRKPPPPGFKVALAQVFYCHAWIAITLVRWFGHAEVAALAAAGLWVCNAWLKPCVRHTWWDVVGCVHWLRQYWREWRDDD